MDPFAGLVDRQAKSPADLLPLFLDGLRFIERAYLEDVRIVPALAQRGMREDEPQRFVGVQQPLLVAHDEAVGIVVVSRIAARVLDVALLILRKIAVMKLGYVKGDQPLVDRLRGQLPISFLEPLAYLAEAGRPVVVVDA